MTDGSGFVHLHNHTEHSALDGTSRIKSVAATAAALGQKAMAITDHGSLAGAWRFQKACLEAGIKPIIGIEIYMSIGSRFERNAEQVPNDDDNTSDADEGKEKVKRYMHLTLLARNETGWKNLIALHNKAEDSYWYKPRIDFDLLKEHGDGLIILSGCLGGPVAGPLSRAGALAKNGDDEGAEAKRQEARDNLALMIDAAGRENVFLEVMYHGIKAEQHAYREIMTLSEETGVPMVATNDCHYEKDCDHEAHDGFLAVGVGKSLDDPNRFAFNGTPDYYVKSEEEMVAVLGNSKNEAVAESWLAACAMSAHVADLCDDKVIPDPRMRLPKYPVPDGQGTSDEFLYSLVKVGAKERYPDGLNDEIKARLRTELDIIADMGFPDYFLIVWDVINWARSDAPINFDDPAAPRKKPILVGVGRGSAAGSLVSYCLKIVGVDPLENHLLFERFLEPGRKGMPDIDVDFEAARRDEVFAYLAYRWGKDRVAHIGTFGMALSKAAIKDAARILKPSAIDPDTQATIDALHAEGKHPQAQAAHRAAMKDLETRAAEIQRLGNKLTDLIPSAGEKAYNFSQLDNTEDQAGDAFRNLVEDSGQDAQDIMRLARAFEGITKTESIHACGFIISPEPLDDIVPMRWQSHAASANPEAPRVICWDGPDCEDIGLLKMDVLGLVNLDIAATALDYIETTTGNRFTLEDIPHPSTKGNKIVQGAYSLLSAGRTSGVFQMESSGMIKIAQAIAPEDLPDISAVVALFRPGPLKAKMDVSYAARKAGEEAVSYTDFTSDPLETEWIDKVLGETYGMAIYQETIMRLSTVIAGFDASQRSRLRKAMGKKKQSEMDACLTMWMEGAPQEFRDEDGEVISPVFSTDTAQKLWDFISGAAQYLFNASHSAAYGQLAYYTAYLKAGWPVEYAAAILAVADKDEKRLTALSSLRTDGIEVLAPDLNKSMERTAPVEGRVLIGLSEIKDVGVNGSHIVREREASGLFASLADMVARVKIPSEASPTGHSKVTSSALQGLIEAGAADSFGPRLGQAMIARAVGKNPGIAVPDAHWDPLEESTRQRQRLGVALGVHPLIAKKDILKSWTVPGGRDERTGQGRAPIPMHRISDTDGAACMTLGVISSWAEKGYSGGRRANFTLESSTTSLGGVIWDRGLGELRRANSIPKIGDIVAVSGKVNVRETVTGDEESETQEVIKTKELNVFTMWPVEAKGEPTVPMESGDNVVKFSDLYHRIRSTPEPPKPGRTKKAEPAPESVEEALVDNVISMEDKRRDKAAALEPAFVRVRQTAHKLGLHLVSGNRSLLECHSEMLIPEKPTVADAGAVYRINLSDGNSIFVLRDGGILPTDRLVKEVKACIDDESRWVRIEGVKSRASVDSTWRMTAGEMANRPAEAEIA